MYYSLTFPYEDSQFYRITRTFISSTPFHFYPSNQLKLTLRPYYHQFPSIIPNPSFVTKYQIILQIKQIVDKVATICSIDNVD